MFQETWDQTNPGIYSKFAVHLQCKNSRLPENHCKRKD